MEVRLTPQEAIKRGLPKPSECDLVIVILWSRIGTPLPADYSKPNGTAYFSGTEWEYHDAITARKGFGKPTVWVYRRNQDSTINQEDPEFDEKRQQWQKVKDFFQTFVGEDGSLTGGVNYYQTPDKFRRQFEQHLRDRLTVVLEELPGQEPTASSPLEAEVKNRVLWTDAPYPGLEAFKPEQAAITASIAVAVGSTMPTAAGQRSPMPTSPTPASLPSAFVSPGPLPLALDPLARVLLWGPERRGGLRFWI